MRVGEFTGRQSVPYHLQVGDSLKVLRVVRDQGEVVAQGRGGNPNVTRKPWAEPGRLRLTSLS
jgi:hypothetical protein